MYSRYEKKALLSKKGAKNVIAVHPGIGYSMQEVVTNKDILSIEELAYICIKSNKGLFVREGIDLDYDDSFIYCDLSSFNMDNGYLLIDNMSVWGVEIVC